MPKFAHLDALLHRFVENGLPGCGVAVAQRGETIYEGYHGYADIDKQIPISADSIFRLYSMTKVIVCTAALMLMERGHFLLNDPLSEYLPQFQNPKIILASPYGYSEIPRTKPMLVRHAFTMSVGLPYLYTDHPTSLKVREIQEELRRKHGNYSLMEFVEALGEVPLACEPGERFMYGFGHDIVAALIEAVSDMTIGEFLKKEIFAPLGMKNTAYRHFANTAERMVSLYKMEQGDELQKISIESDALHQPDARYEGGGSGLFSTVADYLAFSQLLANGGSYNGERLLGRKTIDLMRTNQLSGEVLTKFQNFYNAGYGYGLGVRTMLDPAAAGANSSVGAFGWSGLLGTWVEVDPSEGLSMVYMHQTLPNHEEFHHLRVRSAIYRELN